jgi:DNA topoisomerase-2
MAGSFVGSNNNIPLLKGIGQFGTRLQGGKDAASARYIFCGMGKYTRDLIREDDDSLLEFEEEDGEFVQPKYYMPVLPTILINGQEGVGTGWSTSVPPYNPEEVIENMMLMLDNKPLKEMVPWFRGYK